MIQFNSSYMLEVRSGYMYYSFRQLIGEASASNLLSRWELLRYDAERRASGSLIHKVINLLSAARIAAELGDTRSFKKYASKVRALLVGGNGRLN